MYAMHLLAVAAGAPRFTRLTRCTHTLFAGAPHALNARMALLLSMATPLATEVYMVPCLVGLLYTIYRALLLYDGCGLVGGGAPHSCRHAVAAQAGMHRRQKSSHHQALHNIRFSSSFMSCCRILQLFLLCQKSRRKASPVAYSGTQTVSTSSKSLALQTAPQFETQKMDN